MNNRENNTDLLIVDDLKMHFPIRKGLLSRVSGTVKAVDGVSFSIPKGKTLSLVGESGCGKTTTGRAILRLIEPTDGRVSYNGANLRDLDRRALRDIRTHMQIIFQDPFASLNPRMPVKSIIGEALSVHKIGNKNRREQRVLELLELVGLPPESAGRYPHEFSGGQRQRIGIARALAVEPQLIVADEPVSALDVSIQAQILNLLKDLQEKFDLTYLFIGHDLSVIRHISDYVAVMYLGRIVEIAPVDELFTNPIHPYTKALLNAVPIADPKKRRQRQILQGQVPSPMNPPNGCHFHPRCPDCTDECTTRAPKLNEISPAHKVSCHIHAPSD